MTPERELELRGNIFEMWFELLRRSCENQCDPDLGGTREQLESEYLILEESKEVLKENFIKHYHIAMEVKDRHDENERLLKELKLEQSNGCGKGKVC